MRNKPLHNLYEDIAGSTPDKSAIICANANYSYSEFFDRIDLFSRYLIQHNASPGERVAVVGLTGLDFLAAIYGCFKIGAVAVPIPAHESDRVQNVLQASNAKFVVDKVPNIAEFKRVSTRYSDEALVIFTSGTTSEGRKGVILGHAGISTTAKFMNERMMVDNTIRECVFAPLDHAYAFGRCHAVLMAQGTLLLCNEPLRLQSLLSALGTCGGNALSAAPSVLASLLELDQKRFIEAGSGLRWIQTGAMRFNRIFRELLCESFPQAGIFLHYGLSEAMRSTFLDLQRTKEKRHTEGMAADGVEIGIFGERGERLRTGEEGVIAIRGRNLALGYTDSNRWRDSYRDGWFFTSDLGKLDEEGFLIFIGRNDDVINTNGHIVHPDEIESKLQNLFPTQTFSIVGVADPDGIKDKIIVLCVEGSTAVTRQDLARTLSGLPTFMIPRAIFSVGKLPRTRSGKIVRSQLSEYIGNIFPPIHS